MKSPTKADMQLNTNDQTYNKLFHGTVTRLQTHRFGLIDCSILFLTYKSFDSNKT